MSKEPPEETEFREQPKETFNDDSEERVYGLLKKDGTKIGESKFTSSRFKGQAWYLRDICILPEFERQGYGSQLLELTCSQMWIIKRQDIVLTVPGETLAPDGFDRYEWYKCHGFSGPRDFMVRTP